MLRKNSVINEETGNMRNRIPVISALGFLAALTVLTANSALAQQRLVVPLSDPTRPAILEVQAISGNVSVTAYEGTEVIIVTSENDDGDSASGFEDEPESDFDFETENESEEDDGEDEERLSREGLRQIQNDGIRLTAEENANVVRVGTDWHSSDVDLEISVPRRTSVRMETHNGEDMTITGVVGDHELMNSNGDIAARDIGGSAVINTANGDIEASFTEVTPDKAMSFTSFNGDIDVALPATLSATLVISAGRGDVFTDFDFTLQPTEAVVEPATEGNNYRVRLESTMRAVVGGGGPEIRFQTFNGDVVVRRR